MLCCDTTAGEDNIEDRFQQWPHVLCTITVSLQWLYTSAHQGCVSCEKKELLNMHRGLLESYSDSAHLATYGGQTSVVDENVFPHLIWITFVSKCIKTRQEIENTRIFCNILWKLIIWSIDLNGKAGRIVVAWYIFHWVQLKMVTPTTDCNWMVICQNASTP